MSNESWKGGDTRLEDIDDLEINLRDEVAGLDDDDDGDDVEDLDLLDENILHLDEDEEDEEDDVLDLERLFAEGRVDFGEFDDE